MAGQHGPVLRGDLLQRRGLQHDVGRQQRQPDAQNQALFTINSIFAAGVNRLMIHGFPYAAGARTSPGRASPPSRPTTTARSASARRGGRAPRSGSTSPASPPTSPAPSWCCRPGRRGTTSSFLRQKGWASTGIGPQWIDQQRHQARLVALVHERVAAGPATRRRSAAAAWRPTGRRTRCSSSAPTQLRSNAVTMDVDGAKRVLALGRAGPADRPHRRLVGASRRSAATTRRATAEVRSLMAPDRRPVDHPDRPRGRGRRRSRRARRHPRRASTPTRRSCTCAGSHGDVDLYYLANARHAENRRLNPRRPGRLAHRHRPRRPCRGCSTPGPVRSARIAAFERVGRPGPGAGRPRARPVDRGRARGSGRRRRPLGAARRDRWLRRSSSAAPTPRCAATTAGDLRPHHVPTARRRR